MKKNKKQSEWLIEVEDDQNVLSLDNITLTRWDGLRNWFISKVILPVFKQGYYDSSTGKYVLGEPTIIKNLHTLVVNTSAATHTHTVVDGEWWRVVAIVWRNETDTSIPKLTITPIGETALVFDAYYAAAPLAAGRSFNHLGGSAHAIPEARFILGPGSTIVILDETFTAGDTVVSAVLYEVV